MMERERFWRKTLKVLMDDQSLMRLNLGSGDNPIPGGVNVDFRAECNPDKVHDLNTFPYPFEDNTFDYVHCSQVIEHLDDTIQVMRELYRITKPDGYIYVGVPHFSSRIAYADPTHVRYFAMTTFTHYFPKGCYMSAGGIRLEVKKRFLAFSKMYRWIGVSLLANLSPRSYEDHFAFIFPAKFVHVLFQAKK